MRCRIAAIARRLAVAVVGAAVTLGVSSAPPPSAAAPGPVVTFSFDQPGRPVPRDFLGLSFEAKSLPLIGTYADRGNLATLLRSLGAGLLRFGGVTADTQVAWAGDGAALPDWATLGLHPSDLSAVGRLAAQTGWRVLLTLNFGHYDPQAAADEAGAAREVLGGRLAALAFGNEPDSYVPKQLRPDPWGFVPYEQQLQGYRSAVDPTGVGVPLAGPDVSTGRAHLGWVQAESAAIQPQMLTYHYYPLSWCAGFIPGIEDLLSPGVKGAESRMLSEVADIAAANATPVRIDEANNVSCGGEPGVSNTFASALWATDFIARAMAAGIAGVNLHGNVANPQGYSPLVADAPRELASGQLTAQPEWYALLLVRQLLGDRPLPTRLHGGGLALSAQAFAGAGGVVRLVVVDERPAGSPPRTLVVPLPRRLAGASVLSLTAASAAATGGVRLGGASVAPDGTWNPPPPAPLIPRRRRVVVIPMPATSAALVTLYPRH